MKIYILKGFENFKYSEIEEKLFELSNSKIINMNYKELFLASSFDMVLGEYKNNFKSIKLIDICKNRIDYSIINYFYHNKHCNLLDKKYEEFRIIFFGLNKLLLYLKSEYLFVDKLFILYFFISFLTLGVFICSIYLFL